MVAQDAERTCGVAKTAGDVSNGKTFDEIGAEGLVLALGSRGGFEEEAGLGLGRAARVTHVCFAKLTQAVFRRVSKVQVTDGSIK